MTCQHCDPDGQRAKVITALKKAVGEILGGWNRTVHGPAVLRQRLREAYTDLLDL